MEFRPDEITKIIRSQIKNYETKIEQNEVGTVITVGDGIARAAGLEKCMVNELVEFPNGAFGMAQNLEEHSVSLVILGSDAGIREGDTVRRTGKVVSVPVGENLIGRVVNALGEPIDGKGKLTTQQYRPIEMPAPGVIERRSVSVPLQTGIKAIDAMIPIGRGQRELIIGDRQTGKTTIATDTIINQKGKDVLVVYDDLSKHAVAYRAISLLIRRPPGREAYPGDVFYLHSRLLERAARMAPEYGGGSLTALPIIETQAGDVSAYIPTNVISITDGQIFLETELFHAGVMPAINPGISVSRVGGAAQIKALKKVAGSLKLLYSQYRELQSFAQFGSDLDQDTKDRLAQGARIVEVLKQPNNEPVPVEQQVCIIYAVINGYLKDVPVDQVREFEKGLYRYLDTNAHKVLRAIAETKVLDEQTEAGLKTALENYLKEFKAH